MDASHTQKKGTCPDVCSPYRGGRHTKVRKHSRHKGLASGLPELPGRSGEKDPGFLMLSPGADLLILCCRTHLCRFTPLQWWLWCAVGTVLSLLSPPRLAIAFLSHPAVHNVYVYTNFIWVQVLSGCAVPWPPASRWVHPECAMWERGK